MPVTLPMDHHIHTVFSGHSGMDMLVGNIVRRAEELGLRQITIVEHTPPINSRLQEEVICGKFKAKSCPRAHLDAIIEECLLWKNVSAVRVMAGAEIDADPLNMNGTLLLERLDGLDLVMASTHFLPGGRGMWYERTKFREEILTVLYQEWFIWAMHLAANPSVNVLAHPGASLAAAGAIESFCGSVLHDFEKLLKVCKKFNTAFELNESMSRKLTPKQAQTYPEVIALARDLEVPISISSDAHHLKEVGHFPWVTEVCTTLGLNLRHFYQPSVPVS